MLDRKSLLSSFCVWPVVCLSLFPRVSCARDSLGKKLIDRLSCSLSALRFLFIYCNLVHIGYSIIPILYLAINSEVNMIEITWTT